MSCRELLEILREALAARTLISACAMGGFIVALVHWIAILEALQ